MDDQRRLTGSVHLLYRVGKTRDANGYVVLSSKEHGPNVGRREHRVVAEAALGRMKNPDNYHCRSCRFGKSWNHGRF